ncbi:MAG: transcriptional regulator [Planctomycetota bacterium]
MQQDDFQTQFQKLLEKIEDLPADQRGNLEHLASETKERHQRMKKTISDLQESLDYLRVSVKYLVFDLEATRRENKQLRGMLGEGSEDKS